MPAGRSPATQRVGAARLPARMPDAHGLGADAEPAGHLGLADADGEQLGGVQTTHLEPFALWLCRRVAGDSWHGSDPDWRPRQHQLCQTNSKTR